jgi:hypothetical protein
MPLKENLFTGTAFPLYGPDLRGKRCLCAAGEKLFVRVILFLKGGRFFYLK